MFRYLKFYFLLIFIFKCIKMNINVFIWGFIINGGGLFFKFFSYFGGSSVILSIEGFGIIDIFGFFEIIFYMVILGLY